MHVKTAKSRLVGMSDELLSGQRIAINHTFFHMIFISIVSVHHNLLFGHSEEFWNSAKICTVVVGGVHSVSHVAGPIPVDECENWSICDERNDITDTTLSIQAGKGVCYFANKHRVLKVRMLGTLSKSKLVVSTCSLPGPSPFLYSLLYVGATTAYTYTKRVRSGAHVKQQENK